MTVFTNTPLVHVLLTGYGGENKQWKKQCWSPYATRIPTPTSREDLSDSRTQEGKRWTFTLCCANRLEARYSCHGLRPSEERGSCQRPRAGLGLQAAAHLAAAGLQEAAGQAGASGPRHWSWFRMWHQMRQWEMLRCCSHRFSPQTAQARGTAAPQTNSWF